MTKILFQRLIKWVKNNKKIAGITGFFIIIVIVFFVNKIKNNTQFELVEVSRGNINQEISATGKVNPATRIDLQFKNSGKLVLLNAKINNKVRAGQSLAQQDTSMLYAQSSEIKAQIDEAKAQLNSYKAALEAQSAKLEELNKGTRPEEIKIQEIKVENAQILYEDTKTAVVDALLEAYTQSDDAIRNKIDQFFKDAQTQNPKLTFDLTDLQLQRDVEFGRLVVGYDLSLWKNSADKLSISSELLQEVYSTKTHLGKIKQFLNNIALVINNPSNAPSSISQSTIDGWKNSVSTARTNIDAIINKISSAEERMKTSESSLILAENELILKESGTIQEQINAQKAQVKQAEANILFQEAKIKETEASLNKNNAQIREMILTSPANGVISNVDGNIGEIINSNKIIISIIPDGNLQIDVDISEADIVDIEVGQVVKITLDAFGGDVILKGKVAQIEPAETTVGNATYYKTKVLFDNQDKKIKSGMTANIWIKTANKENVLIIPANSIKEKTDKKYVEVLENGEVKRKDIKTGLKGVGGIVEVISGLKEGDKIIVSTEKK